MLNVATPPTAATVAVPLRVPLPGFVPIAIVTFDVSAVRFAILVQHLHRHRRGNRIAGSLFVGCWTKASWDAAAGVTLRMTVPLIVETIESATLIDCPFAATFASFTPVKAWTPESPAWKA